MTAPRECRQCGARLPPSLPWCTQCLERVRHLTPRDPQLPPLPDAEEPPPWVPSSPLRGQPPATHSRWRAGPTTFGPVGRVLITLSVVTFFPWETLRGLNPLGLWYYMAYMLAATLILRHTWRKERVVHEPGPGPRGLSGWTLKHMPRLMSVPIDARVVLAALGVLVAASLAITFAQTGSLGRYYFGVAALAGGAAVLLAWLNDV